LLLRPPLGVDPVSAYSLSQWPNAQGTLGYSVHFQRVALSVCRITLWVIPRPCSSSTPLCDLPLLAQGVPATALPRHWVLEGRVLQGQWACLMVHSDDRGCTQPLLPTGPSSLMAGLTEHRRLHSWSLPSPSLHYSEFRVRLSPESWATASNAQLLVAGGFELFGTLQATLPTEPFDLIRARNRHHGAS
jgi:hypothetical protein